MSQETIWALDGNAAAGMLRDVFAFDATVALVTCAGCAARVAIGHLRLYDIEMGAILRCPTCEYAVLRIARTPRGLWLDMRGAATLVVGTDGDETGRDAGP